MKKNTIIALVAVLFLTFCVRLSAENSNLSVENLIIAVSHAESLIKDIQVKSKIQVYTKDGDSPTPTPYYHTCTFKVKGVKRYISLDGYFTHTDQPDAVIKSSMEVAYDGTTSTYAVKKENAPKEGYILEGKSPLLDVGGYFETPEGFSFWAYKTATLSEIIKQIKTAVKIENDTIDGISCYKITIPPVDKESLSRRIWLDPSRSFNIIRQERFNEYNGKILGVFENYRLAQFGSGIWFPVEAKAYSLMLKPGEPIRIYHYLVENPKEDVAINTNIADDSFILKFEPGVRLKQPLDK